MSRRSVLLAAVALAATAGAAVLVFWLLDSGGAGDALATERQRRASGIQIAADEALLWGNLVVYTEREEGVELHDVELLGASPGLTVRRALVADGRRPQERLLVFGERTFAELPNHREWRRSFHALRGYRVEPVDGPWKPGFEESYTRDGRWRTTEVVIEFEPIGRAKLRVTKGVRLHYRAGGDEGTIDLPNQLTVCAPSPCNPIRPEGF